MGISYDLFTGGFLSKITEFEFSSMIDTSRVEIVDGYMKRAIAAFRHICNYDLTSTADDSNRVFNVDIDDIDLMEIVDIVSEGMIIHWLSPFLYNQELLENALNTRDFTTYSPAELLMRVGNAYATAKKNYTQMMREYSFNHGDLSALHL